MLTLPPTPLLLSSATDDGVGDAAAAAVRAAF
jgi:hypothetical protein